MQCEYESHLGSALNPKLNSQRRFIEYQKNENAQKDPMETALEGQSAAKKTEVKSLVEEMPLKLEVSLGKIHRTTKGLLESSRSLCDSILGLGHTPELQGLTREILRFHLRMQRQAEETCEEVQEVKRAWAAIKGGLVGNVREAVREEVSLCEVRLASKLEMIKEELKASIVSDRGRAPHPEDAGLMCVSRWQMSPLVSFQGGGGGSDEMGSNLSKRRSASSGNLTRLPRQPDKYKLCGSLPNHLDVPPDNNNEREGGKVSGRGVVEGGSAAAAEDLGYGSERSPPDPPPADPPFPACPVHHAQLIKNYPFINSGSIFSVVVRKGSGGLGLSVCGGDPWPGLVRIKRLFPHQPASHSGLLSPGDILLAASGVPLLGLTNYEALEVLRSAPSEVRLTICRPPERVVPPAESVAPPPPPRDPPLLRPHPSDTFGEFEISMEKVNGSLGFTLRKEDQSVLGHYVRALVREPALSDPRIRPGDKIVAVNDVEMSGLTHEEAVAFLRQCGVQVKLRLYRDPVQTPLPPHSPTHSHRTFKPILRKEAQDMLSELAIKKSQSPQDSSGSSASKGSSPRKRRLTRTPPPSDSVDSIDSTEDDDRPRRPENLVLGGDRKPNYQFSPNVDVELEPSGLEVSGPPPTEPVSMPPLPAPQPPQGFSYRNPAYRSANPPPSKPLVVEELPEGGCSEQDIPSMIDGDGGTKSLLKWKGVLFNSEEKEEGGGCEGGEAPKKQDSSSQCAPPAESPEYEVVIVELVRGWNSRLGFSLQNQDGASVISAIYPDSVASRDGRLRIGDKLINVNDENIDEMTTPDVIDLLRKIRGSICLTLLRKAK